MIIITTTGSFWIPHTTFSILDTRSREIWRDENGRAVFGEYDPDKGLTGNSSEDYIDFLRPSDTLYFDAPISSLGDGTFRVDGFPPPLRTTTTSAPPVTVSTAFTSTTSAPPGEDCNPICVLLSGFSHDLCWSNGGDHFCDELNGSYKMCWSDVTRAWIIDACDPPDPVFNGSVMWIPGNMCWCLEIHLAWEWNCSVCFVSYDNVPFWPDFPRIEDCPPKTGWIEEPCSLETCDCTGGSARLYYGDCGTWTTPPATTTTLAATTTTTLATTTTTAPPTTTTPVACDPICVQISGYDTTTCFFTETCDSVNGSYELTWHVANKQWQLGANSSIYVRWDTTEGGWRARVEGNAPACDCRWSSSADPPEYPVNPTVNDCPPASEYWNEMDVGWCFGVGSPVFEISLDPC